MIKRSKKEEKLANLAEESDKTKKAREKLRKQLETIESKVTKQAIEKKSLEIHRWIGRHANNRTILKSKQISLFDENQNPAKESSRIEQMTDELKVSLDTEKVKLGQ